MRPGSRSGKGRWATGTAWALFLLQCASWAQSPGEIRGGVQTNEGAPLPQAVVYLSDRTGQIGQETTSDAAGAFQFLQLPAGRYRVEVSLDGYIPEVREEIPLADGESLEINFRLERRRTTLREAEERGAEQRNPNIFIRRIDNDALLSPLGRWGIEPSFLEFRADENQFGAHMGAPVRQVLYVRPQEPVGRLHASAYWSHENSAFAARPFFNVGSLRSFKRNQFGFNSSGDLVAERLFFTTSLDIVRESGFVNGNIRIPLPSERTPTSSDPATAAIVAALLQAYPAEDPNLPNVAARQLNTNSIRRIDSLDWNLRMDYLVSDRDSLAFQYTLFDYLEEPYELVVGQNPETDVRPQSFSTTHTHTWSPATLLQSSFHFDRLAALLVPTELFRSLLQPLGLDRVPDVRIGVGSGGGGDLSPIGSGTQFPRERFQNRFTGNLAFTHQKGRHLLRFGGRTTRVQVNDLQSDNSRGTLIFSENFGRTQVENLLEGTPTRFTIALGDLYRGFRNWEHALYLQDTFQIKPGLTLNLGLRYEAITVPREVNDLTQFDYSTDANNFAPQLSLAWAPGAGSTVVRAGYGISFGHIFPGTYQLARFNPPAVTTVTVQNPDLSNLFEDIEEPEEPVRSERLLLSPDLVSPYIMQYQLVIQRRLPKNLFFEIGYVGHRTKKPFLKFVSNRAQPVPGIPPTTATIDERRPDPNFLRIQTVMNSGTFFYDGLKAGLRRVSPQGLVLNIDYLFSKALSSNVGGFLWEVNRGLGPPISQNNENFHLDLKGPTFIDHQHILTFRYSYQFPFRFSNSLASALLGGWQISGFTDYRTGRWFGIETSSDAPGFGNVDGEGGDRPNIVDTVVLGKSFDHPDTSPDELRPEFFNSDIAPGGRGDAAVRAFRADDIFNTNLALRKSFSFSDRDEMLQFMAEFRNLFNHPWFDTPGDVFPTDVFGKILDTQNKGRTIQFSLRLNF